MNNEQTTNEIMTNSEFTKEATNVIANHLKKEGYIFFIDGNDLVIGVEISSTCIVHFELPITDMGETNVFDWNGNRIASSTSPFIAFRNFNKWALSLAV
tara:strand:- start:269 stop:565 length:297 start_codon:yes stop_codon:yes gene_type:complete